MGSDNFELSDISSGTEIMGSGKRSSGCHVSTAIGFVLALLAIAIAVGVGILVHFAGGGSPCVCQCAAPQAPASGAQGGKEPSPSVDPCVNCPCSTDVHTTTVKPTASVSTGSASSTTNAPSSTTSPSNVTNVRLPTDLDPVHYLVELQPNMYEGDPKDFTFNGSVEIDLLCVSPTREVKVHINKLNVTNFSFEEKGGNLITTDDYTEDKERQFFVLPLRNALETGKTYVLKIGFVGWLADDLAGIYRSSYYDKERNKTVYIATTQLQPTDARKTFPCFDEPAIKSNFTVTLVRKSHMVSISNMPIREKEDRGNGWIADHYETTVKMSTYLLAFIVCDFVAVERNTSTNTTVRVWARPEAINQTAYALKAGVEILEYFEEYFKIPYPLPKQDMIAIPDFAAGAMENWGLITYRETALLYDPKVSSATNKQRVAVVVAHELAHQWFGNLVTPSWWDDLWLNEGFASYVEYLGTDFLEPSWDMMEQFITEDLQDVMELDGLGSSHPIFVPVNHPDEINEIFDRISYAKGASIIRMMNFFLTEDIFKAGLIDYLRLKAYGAATKDDLWASLTKADVGAGDLDVKKVMDTWTLQMGYPVVKVKVCGNTLELEQKHFLLDPNQQPDDERFPDPGFGYQWEIPFTYATNSAQCNSSTIEWMGHKEKTKEISVPGTIGPDDWVIANVGQYGYYRVNYQQSNWEKLLGQLKRDHQKVCEVNRAQIIDDAFNLARSGDVGDLLLPMKTTEYLINETDYLPWEAALNNLNYVQSMLMRSQYFGDYQAYMLKQITPLYDIVTWVDNTSTPITEQYRRIFALSQACSNGLVSCQQKALQKYAEWMNTTDPDLNNPITPNLKSLVYCNAISRGGRAEWEFAFERYQKANVASEKSKLLYAMSCSTKVWILSRYLDWTLDDSKIRKQDATSTIIYISRNSIGRSLAWDFLRRRFDYIYNEYGGGSFSFSNLITGVTSSFNTDFDLQQLQEFRDKYPDMGSGTRAAQQAIEKTKSNINWMKNNLELVGAWLASRS